MKKEIKVGDKVRVSKNAPKVYLSSVNNLFKYHVCKVEEVDGDSAIIRYTDIGIDRWLAIPCKYLVKVEEENKIPRIGDCLDENFKRFMDESLKYLKDPIREYFRKPESEKEDAVKIPVALDFSDSYWKDYEAQLAHDVAVKCANQVTIDNPALADCVTALARKITDGLKRK